MTIPQVVDGVTDADAAFMNQLVDAANQANAAFNGAGQITTAAITPALEEAYDDPSSVLGSLRASADGIQDGTLPIPLAGIEGALGEYGPLQNMRAGVANVLDKGAVADGVTDSTAAFLDAVDDAGVVDVPDGEYRIDPFQISYPVVFRLGKNAILKRRDAGSASLIQVLSNNVSLVGGVLDGNGAGSDVFAGLVGLGPGVADFAAEFVTFRNAGVTGVTSNSHLVSGTGPARFRGCSFLDLGGYGIQLNWGYSGSVVLDCTFDRISGNGVWTGNGCERVLVSRNSMVDIGRIGVEFWVDSPDSRAVDNHIALGTASSEGQMGISLAGGDRCAAVGNRIVVTDPDCFIGIEMTAGRNIQSLGNFVYGPTHHAFSVDSAENSSLVGNVIDSVGSSIDDLAVVVVDGGADVPGFASPKHVNFSNNIVRNCAGRGLQLQTDVEDVYVGGNHFIDNAGQDLFIHQARFVTILGNTFDSREISGSGEEWRFMQENEHGSGGGHMIAWNRFLGDKSTAWIPNGVTTIVGDNYGVS